MTRLNSTGTDLIYSTYIGGSEDDEGYAIAIDGIGNAYVMGNTESSDYDTTPGAFQTTYGGGYVDVFVTKLDLSNSTGAESLVNKPTLFSIFPNPSNGSFTIQSKKGGVFELTDISGRIFNTYTLTRNQESIQENLAAGMYFVREKETGALQKLVVQW